MIQNVPTSFFAIFCAFVIVTFLWGVRKAKAKTRKTKTLVFFLGEIIKLQLPLPLGGKMNKINALTLKNNNLASLFQTFRHIKPLKRYAR